ncbi:hypothetical protein AB7849_18990 [Rhodanobacter sp. 115]|uniref:hypothetical protein n=1 Tax=Rhodanobacter sp. FW021-MT20 TaxID=1162282 RepID=UPI0034E43ED9
MGITRHEFMPLDQALELVDHVSPAPESAHQALLAMREHIRWLELMAHLQSQARRDAVESIVRAACETDPAEPGKPDTICIGVEDLKTIVGRYIVPDEAVKQPALLPIPMILFCPECSTRHVDAPDHRTHHWSVGDRALTPFGVGTISRVSSGTGFTEYLGFGEQWNGKPG